MESNNIRFIFALLCCTGLVAIATGAYLEIARVRRKTSVISPRHLRWRMLSTLVWVLILGSLAYATLFEWPPGPGHPQGAEKFQRFSAIMLGSMLLMMVATFLFAIDLTMTLKERRAQEKKFGKAVLTPASEEVARILRDHNGPRNTKNGTGPQK